MCSLLLGRYVDIDYSDAGGMNLMDLHAKRWDHKILANLGTPFARDCIPFTIICSGESMDAKLGAPIPSHSVVGDMHPYYVQRFGFNTGRHTCID